MEKFEYQVKLTVQIDAFDDSDAWDILQEAFGIGDQLGVTVVDCEYREVKKKRK